MSSATFIHDWVSPPGDTISDLLSERGLSLDEFAWRLGESPSFATELLHGRVAITEGIAEALTKLLGASMAFWLAREQNYRDDLRRFVQGQDPIASEKWLDEVSASELVSLGWVDQESASIDRTTACLRFFGVPNPRAWQSAYSDVLGTVAFRTSKSYPSHLGAVAAWLRQGEIMATSMRCKYWSASELFGSVEKIRSLTRERDPDKFIPTLQALCASAGVAVVVMRAPSKCRASGAVRTLARDRRLLLLSCRYKSDDHFWFTVFHEIGHLLLHPETPLIIEGEETISRKMEDEANAFAGDVLIPAEFRDAMQALPLDGRRVMRFAKNIGVSPGIVVGQMQNAGLLRPNQLNNLKQRYAWDNP